jgi:hypothetical protein
MDKIAKVAEHFKNIGKPKGDAFIYAIVKEITGDTCTVTIGELELTDVRLKATDDSADDKLLVIPTVGSKVVIGTNPGSMNDLFVIRTDDPEIISYKHGDLQITIDTEKINYTNGNLQINIDAQSKVIDIINKVNISIDSEAGTVQIKNDQVSLVDLFTEMVNILKTLTVSTPAGPSGTPLPPTIQLVTQFETDFKKILK